MQCLSCRASNRASNAFCEACGAALHLTCSTCGKPGRADSRFCGHCGSPFDKAAASSLNTHLRALSVSGGEYKRLTVLFADIRNSTQLISRMDPESAVQRMQPALDAMRDAVHRYDGLVNKVQGDGIMALFGAPRPHEDHAVRGCLAALVMQDAVTRLGDRELQIRVGVHTGEVVVQAVNNSLYQTYDAAGVAVHLANRLENEAGAGYPLISNSTFTEARQFIDARPLGPQQIRGIAEPIDLFALLGSRPAPASERFRTGPRSSRFNGRESELALLRAQLAKAEQRDLTATNVIGIVGEAGLGKSRICFEFAETCRRQGIRVHETRVLSHGRATPFQPVVELLRNAFCIQPDDSREVARQRAIETLAERGNFDESLPLVLDLLGLQDKSGSSKLDPTNRKHKLLSFVRQFVHARLDDEMVVVLAEDLHWIDQASEEFVEALVDAVVGTRTLLVLNFRPGYTAPWMQRSHYHQMTLSPLDPDGSNNLLSDLLGNDPSLTALARDITERAQGNPFFIEELVQSLAERGDFDGERGAYRLKDERSAIPLPSTVQAVLAARIDSLPDAVRQRLQIAAVIGREVPLAILERIAPVPPDQLSQSLLQLRRAELLYELPPFNKSVHAFRHPLIQDVAYQSLLQSRRRELHRAAAEAFTEHFRDSLDEHSGLIAYHLEQAGDALAAAQAHARAAIWIGARDPSQALRSWMKTRELLADQPSSKTVDYLRMMACGQVVNFGWREGIPVEEGRVYFEEAKQIAASTGNLQANAMIHAGFGRLLAVRGSADEYAAKAQEAVALGKLANDASLEVMLKAGLCHALRLAGRLNEALEVNIEATERAHEVNKLHRQMLGFDIEPWLTALRGQLLLTLGRYDDARTFLDRVIQMDSSQINVADHVMPSISYVDLAWLTDDALLARQHAERAFTLAQRSGSPYLQTYATAARGLSHIVDNEPRAAIEYLSTAIEFARRRRAGLEYEPRILADLAYAYFLDGDLTAAQRTADDAIRVALARNTRIAECLARIVRARTLIAQDDSDAAEIEAELQRTEALIAEIGARCFTSLVRDVRGAFAERRPKRARVKPSKGGTNGTATAH